MAMRGHLNSHVRIKLARKFARRSIHRCYSPLQTVVRKCLTYSTKCCIQGLAFWCPSGEFALTHLTPHGWTITLNHSSSNDRKPFTMAARDQCCKNSTVALIHERKSCKAGYAHLSHYLYTFCSYVRSTRLFYALPKYLKDELVRVEKRAISIICPGLPYQQTLELVKIVPIVDSSRAM